MVGGLGSEAGRGTWRLRGRGKFGWTFGAFSQSLKIARNAGRRTQLSHTGYAPVPPADTAVPVCVMGCSGYAVSPGSCSQNAPQKRGGPSLRHA